MKKKLSYLLLFIFVCILSIPPEVFAAKKTNITVEQMREVNAYGDAIESSIIKQVG